MYTDGAKLYDLVYSFKDYEKEAGEIVSMIKSRPQAKTVLDAGCGTGEHHKYLKNEFLVDGLDMNEEYIRVARRKNGAGTYYVRDMVDFRLNWQNGRLHLITYDREDLKICRMNICETDGRLSIVNFHYLIGTSDKDVQHFEELHEFALFSGEEMRGAFEEACFAVSYDEKGLIGRGMYFGTK
jgi:SAM-dependent methyltransferase